LWAPPRCFEEFRTRAATDIDGVCREVAESIEQALGTEISLPEDLRIVLSPEPIYIPPRALVRGGYDPVSRTIILSNGLWCRKTLVHEMLHAVSYFTRVPQLLEVFRRETDFVEGLTEFLTGYVLYSAYRECYQRWLSREYIVCSISYERFVRLFGALAHVYVSIRDLVRLYIYDPGRDWFREYEEFLRRYGLEDFLLNKPREMRRVPSSMLLEDIASKALRQRFGEERVSEFIELLYEAPLDVVLDYSTMLR